jgi:fructosamine-3-kinase
LASLHRSTQGQQIGLEINNFLGAAPQINTPANCWSRFVAEYRLGFQLRWAADQGLDDAALRRDVELILRQLDQLLSGSESTTSLLHGDLWSGNYLGDSSGAPVLIDPAVYYGNREAEFGMLKLFGACPRRFYEAYHEAFSFADGWQRRINVYVLYHLLNHLNLFGRGYLAQCVDVAGQILRAE